jgi:colanic acid/amylovoran biosynthesis glycosyltransferase
MSAEELPTVAHAMHAYLARTETFVQNQLTTLRRWRPVVVCHHLRPQTDFSFQEGATATSLLPPVLARVDSLAYRVARITVPQATRALADYVLSEDARLIHYHFLTDARFLLGLKRTARLPAVVSCYGYDVSSFPRKWKGLGKRYLQATFDQMECFLAMSEDMRDDLLALGCPESRIRVHYHGSNTRRFRFQERVYDRQGPLTILCCARLEPRKAQDLVFQALRQVEKSGREQFRIVVVGEGAMRSRLERLIADYHWAGRVTMTGHIPHTSERLVEQFRAADIFVQPSVTINGLKEGIPGTIVEAMAAGLPIVASAHAGIPTVIENRRHGLLVRERDQDGLAEALEALLADPQLRERLGRAAAERAQLELDIHVRAVELERIYDDVSFWGGSRSSSRRA